MSGSLRQPLCSCTMVSPLDLPPPAATDSRLQRTLLLALLGWTLVAAATSQVISVYLPLSGMGNPPWWQVFRWALPGAWFWALLTPAVLELARRERWDRVSRPRFVAVHLTAATTMHFASAALEWSLRPWLRPSAAGDPIAAALVDGLVFDLAGYAVMVAGVHAVEFRAMYERESRAALQLRADLLESQLAMWRSQLQPHFLFNALHAVSELVYRDPRLADRAITRLADLLRASLASEAEGEIALADELELLAAYVEIEQLRAGDTLQVQIDVAPETLPMAVPVLLLQPLVENAIRHGVRGRARGCVRVVARLTGHRLDLRVEDDGAGPAGPCRDGVGLRTTRARLIGLHGDAAMLTLEPRTGGGAIARVSLPARQVATNRCGDHADTSTDRSARP